MNGPLIQFFQGVTQGNATLVLSSLTVIALLLLVCFPVHEFAHAYVATRLGDDTARLMGRVTLNPLAHLDPLGTIFFLAAGFGWAKPVPVTPYRLKGDPRTGMAIVALAGPVSNILLAIGFAIMYRVISPLIGIANGVVQPNSLGTASLLASTIGDALITAVFLNLILALFNIIPIPPLDGSRILAALLPEEGARLMSMIERYGFMVLMVITFAVPTLMSSLVMRPASSLARLLLGF